MWQSIRAGAAGVAWLAAALLVATPVLGASVGVERWRIDTPDGPRNAMVLPPPIVPAPTVVVLHGAVNSAGWAAWRFGFKEAAAARGFAAAFPQGLGLQWNDGRGRTAPRADDVAFLHRLAAELVERGVARHDRIYVAGISNGGMMALRLVCEGAEFLAGVGTVIANMPADTGADCRPLRPVPIVMFNGTADRLIPYEGGRVGLFNLGGLVWGAERTAAFLAEANGCTPEPAGSDAEFGRMSVTRLRWTSCVRNATVTLYRMNGSGHIVPGRRHILSGMRTDELSAAETILATFARE